MSPALAVSASMPQAGGMYRTFSTVRYSDCPYTGFLITSHSETRSQLS